MTNKDKYRAWQMLDKYTSKIYSTLYEKQELELEEILEIDYVLKMLKDNLRLEVLHND